ncbi:hypothetical protein [Pseudoalteromonas sp. GW168-MNA-CIBAN-0100]|uniref:hypothetical protein n=1 Tax=Pseudoalteromonas sp. GW168-MNA-CIBAN-0100 TaxID=3140434 RepID=UPI0033286364
MCQFKSGELFKLKRKKAKELKPVLDVISRFSKTSESIKASMLSPVRVLIGMEFCRLIALGDSASIKLICKRADKAGL